jgi:hypothetical protein
MRRLLHAEQGQAAVEFLAVLPLVAMLAAALWQAALAGHAVWMAGSAARAGARAQAVGGDPARAARSVLPEPLARGLRVRLGSGGEVHVLLRVPAIVGGGAVATVGAAARFTPQRSS